MVGIEMIAKERQRQIEEKGYTNDIIFNPHGELARAAVCYTLPPEDRQYHIDQNLIEWKKPVLWPWPLQWWKPSPNDRIRELVKAGALIAAEIDRLQKIKSRNETNA